MLQFDNFEASLHNKYLLHDLYGSDDILSMAQHILSVDLAVDRAELLNKYSIYNIDIDKTIEDIEYSNDKCEYTNIADICQITSDYFIDKIKANKKKIAVFWSGGVDSTCVVVSFLNNKNTNFNDFYIILTEESLNENLYFFNNYIKNKCFYIIYNSNNYRQLIDDMINKDEYIFISGHNGDQLFGHKFSREYPQFYNMQWQKALYYIYKLYIHNKNYKYIYELSNKHIQIYEKYFDTLGLDIKTVNDFTWAINFMFKWTNVRMEHILRSNNKKLFNYYYTFFSNKLFQHWAIYRHNNIKNVHNMYYDKQYYKQEFKEYIYAYDKNEDYRMNKGKFGSYIEHSNENNCNDFFIYDNEGLYKYTIKNKFKNIKDYNNINMIKYIDMYEIKKGLNKYIR